MSDPNSERKSPKFRRQLQLWPQKAMDETDEGAPKGGGIEGGGVGKTGGADGGGKTPSSGPSSSKSTGAVVFNIEEHRQASSACNNGGESGSSVSSTVYTREDSIRSGKSVSISVGESVGDRDDAASDYSARVSDAPVSTTTSTPASGGPSYGWRVMASVAGGGGSGGLFRSSGGGSGAQSPRPLCSIMENVKDSSGAGALAGEVQVAVPVEGKIGFASHVLGEVGGRRGTLFHDIYHKPPPANPNTKLLAVNYITDDKKGKNIKVSPILWLRKFDIQGSSIVGKMREFFWIIDGNIDIKYLIEMSSNKLIIQKNSLILPTVPFFVTTWKACVNW